MQVKTNSRNKIREENQKANEKKKKIQQGRENTDKETKYIQKLVSPQMRTDFSKMMHINTA